MIFNRIGSIAFAVTFICFAILLLGYGNKSYIKYGIIGFGMIGFACYILSYFFDKNAKSVAAPNTSLKSLMYYSGWTLALIGVLFKVMHWPGFLYIILAGTLIAGISFFLPSKDIEQEKDETLLDN